MEPQTKRCRNNQVVIRLDPAAAQEFFEILCELPFRPANGFEMTPPTEREEPVEDVLNQITQQIHDEDDELEELI